MPAAISRALVAALQEYCEGDKGESAPGNIPMLVATLEWIWGMPPKGQHHSSPPRLGAAPSTNRPPIKLSVADAMPQSPAKSTSTPARSGLPPMSPAALPKSNLGVAAQRQRPAPGNHVPSESPRLVHRRRPSLEGIDAMQAQLNALQVELKNSPRYPG